MVGVAFVLVGAHVTFGRAIWSDYVMEECLIADDGRRVCTLSDFPALGC